MNTSHYSGSQSHTMRRGRASCMKLAGLARQTSHELAIASARACLASPANFIYGRVLAKVLSHVTIMPVLLRPVNNFLGQVIGNASEGKYNTVNNSSSGEVTFQKCLKSGITLFSSKNSNKSQTFATGPYQRLHEARNFLKE